MTKAELIDKVVKEANVTKRQAEISLKSIVGSLAKSLKQEGRITIIGFGTFSISKRKARKGRNPQTGETIKIAASKSARFKPGKAFKELL